MQMMNTQSSDFTRTIKAITMNRSSERLYEDFEPISDFISVEGYETSILYLPGFRKDQLKVQLTSSRILRVVGERPIGDNKWKRFNKEFGVTPDADTKGITAKFEGGILLIKQPKVTASCSEAGDQQVTPTQDDAQKQLPTKPQTQKDGPNDVIPESGESEAKSDNREEEESKSKDELERKDREVVNGSRRTLKELGKPEKPKKLRLLLVSAVLVLSILMLLLVGVYSLKLYKTFYHFHGDELLEIYD